MDQKKIDNMKQNLMAQVGKMMHSTNRHSIETRHRYEDGTERFCGFLAEKYQLQKFENVKEKHFVSYAKNMVENEYSGKTITTDLSSIRFFHDLSGSRNALPENKELKELGVNIPPVEVGVVDRAWTDREIEKAKNIASAMGRQDVTNGIEMSRSFGLRINELASLRVSQLENALKDEELFIRGKGGVERVIPVRTEIQISSINAALDYARENGRDHLGDRVIAENAKGGVRHEKESLQNWVSNHRGKFEEDFRTKDSVEFENQKAFCETQGFKIKTENVSWHGLRHAYAQERYAEIYEVHIHAGQSIEDAAYHARLEVSHELGHYRDSITNVYLR